MNRKRVVLILVGLAVLVLGVYVVVRSRGADEALLASGTVEATEAGLGFQVPGRIERVVPNEGDRVRAGDQLAWLDRTELEARRAQAAAQLVARAHPIAFVGHHAFDPARHLKAESGFGGLDGARSQEGLIRASAPNHHVDAEH